MIEVGFYGMGLALLIHTAFVSVTLGVGVITALYRYLAFKKGDSYLENFAKRTFRIMVTVELFSGVWGTIVTVFLAGMFPNLLALATNVLFVPIAIALVGIMIRIPSIAIFWYTWGRIGERVHVIVGFLMAFSGFLIPLGFRTIFAELDYPFAIANYLTTKTVDVFQAFFNPVFVVLFLHTLFAALSIGGFAVVSLMSVDKDSRGIAIGWKFGYYFLIPQIALGAIYWLTLAKHSAYIYNTITFGSYATIFAVKLILVTLLLFFGAKIYLAMKLSEEVRHAKILAPLAIATAVFGETINSGSRYPYMVILDEKGIPVSAFFNYYMEIPLSMVYVILAFLFLAIAVFMTALFYAIVKKYLEIPGGFSEIREIHK